MGAYELSTLIIPQINIIGQVSPKIITGSTVNVHEYHTVAVESSIVSKSAGVLCVGGGDSCHKIVG